MNNKNITALIGLVGTISAAIIGVIWGKNINVNVRFEGLVSEYESQIEKLKKENDDLKSQLEKIIGELDEESDGESDGESNGQSNGESNGQSNEESNGQSNGQSNDGASIQFRNLGLCIDGEEKNINKDKSMIYVNDTPYYSQDFIDNLLPSNKAVTINDNVMYIGKIVKEKANLFDMHVIEKSSHCYFIDSIKDTYGNIYRDALVFYYHNNFTTFNVNRGYSYFKCTVAMQDKYKGKGFLQVKTDGNTIYTSSEVTNITEPFEIDIPINQTSIISIGTIGDKSSGSRILITNAVLYNQE